VYSPDNIGRKDVLIGGGKILGIFEPDAPEVEMLVGSGLCNTVNASGTSVVPGLVDIHVHVTGGGGESGPESKVCGAENPLPCFPPKCAAWAPQSVCDNQHNISDLRRHRPQVPEAQISQLVKAGITTVVGILGTDSLSRSVSELLTKVNALNRGPITGNVVHPPLAPCAATLLDLDVSPYNHL
jgi:beta-aspartyl-dipeptidase (metallo-type)